MRLEHEDDEQREPEILHFRIAHPTAAGDPEDDNEKAWQEAPSECLWPWMTL